MPADPAVCRRGPEKICAETNQPADGVWIVVEYPPHKPLRTSRTQRWRGPAVGHATERARSLLGQHQLRTGVSQDLTAPQRTGHCLPAKTAGQCIEQSDRPGYMGGACMLFHTAQAKYETAEIPQHLGSSFDLICRNPGDLLDSLRRIPGAKFASQREHRPAGGCSVKVAIS